MARSDLYAGGVIAHHAFCHDVVTRAAADWRLGVRPVSGKQLCDQYASDYRKGHIRLASGLYNKIRWSLSLAEDAESKDEVEQ